MTLPPDAGSSSGAPGRRAPRPLAVHCLVDAAVVFLCVAVVGLLAGLPFLGLVLGSAAVGVAAAPMTHRLEQRALAARRSPPDTV